MSKAPRPPKIRPLAPVDPNQRYEVAEAIQYLRQSRAKLYNDISAGLLNVIRDGKRIYVPGSEIIRRSTLSSAA